MRSPFAYEHYPKIERTFRIRGKRQRLKKKCKARKTSPRMDAAAGGQRMTLRNFITLGVQYISSSIVRSTMEVNNLELRPAIVSVVQHTQFGGSPIKNPNL